MKRYIHDIHTSIANSISIYYSKKDLFEIHLDPLFRINRSIFDGTQRSTWEKIKYE